MAGFNKTIRELGIVISKRINEARTAGESFDGTRKWDARDEEYIVEVVSCDEDDLKKDTGITNGTRAEYKVDKETYDKVKFLDYAKVKFTAVQFGEKLTIKPVAFELIEKK